VMARYSYPLERMSVEDHRLLFARSVAPAAPAQGDWEGHLILLDRTATTLLTPPPTALFRLSGADGKFRIALDGAEDVVVVGVNDLRALDADTLIGRWSSSELPPSLAESLRGYVEPYASEAVFYYLLKRMKAATGLP